jgi:hypothetical protein
VSAWISVPGFLGTKQKQIGYLKRNQAERIAPVLDSGHKLWAKIREIYDPPGRVHPDVKLHIGYDD